MGGSSKSSSSSKQSTTTRDERIAATDSATVIKDALNNAKIDLTIPDSGAVDSLERISLAILEGAGKALDQTTAGAQAGLDKVLEYINAKEEDSNSSNAQKIIPWLVAGVSILALSSAIVKR